MSSFFFSLMCFILPTSVCRWLCILFGKEKYKIGKKCSIGFSFIKAEKVILADNAKIGHFNFIKTKEVHIAGRINHFNLISGGFIFVIEDKAWINGQNKITGSNIDEKVINTFIMKSESSIIVHHVFDVTDNVLIGERTCIAGYGSQLWTHSFVFGTSKKAAKISKPVVIGRNCYIGSGCVLCPGVTISDNVVVGAHTTVSRDLKEAGLYVSQSIRYIPYNPDSIICQLEENGLGYIFDR